PRHVERSFLCEQSRIEILDRPTLFTYTATPEDLQANADDLFSVVSSGKVKISVNQTYALKDAAQAHRDLEARKTTGSTVLKP
ncbi:MAG: zinc-binding dehydrogenase, partial [Pseudomonadota bacterium]